MNTPTTNPTTALSRWSHFSRMIRGFLGVPLSVGLTAAILFVVLMAGCKEDEGQVVGVCDNTPPLAGVIAPACGATSVPLNQKVTATFNEAMDSSTVTTATFTLAGPSGTPVSGTVTYVSATNIATFTPAGNLAASTTYTYTIKGGENGAKDMAGNALANNFACGFTTGAAPDITPPTVTSTDPANNATGVLLGKVTSTGAADDVPGAALYKKTGTAVTAGVASCRMITATFSEAMDPSTITTSTVLVTGPGVTPVAGTVAYAGPSFTATFVPANNLTPNTTYTGTITSGTKDLAGNALASNYVWSFQTGVFSDTTRPTVTSTDPANGATGVPLSKVTSKDPAQSVPGAALNKKTGRTVTAVGKIITASFSEAMDPLAITSSTFTVTGPGVSPVTGSVTYAGPSFTATFVSANNLAPSTTYTGTITTGAKDLAGNALASNYIWNFTTGAAPDITPPTVIFTDPANNATGVALNKKIAATFSEAMDPSTIKAITFTLQTGTTSILGAVTYTGTTALFTPASNLAPNTTYTGTITTGAKDLAGNALASNYIWNFTTGVAPDITSPTVIFTDPANNATGVALNKKIAATFSEAMDPLTITTNTFSVRQGTTSVSGTLTYVGTIAVFTPANNLASNTVYTATFTIGAKDLAGNALASNYVWNFTTAAAPDLTPPTVISTDPTNNATGVAPDKRIAATFSEAMDPSSITTATVSLTGLGGVSVTGTVSYAAIGDSLTFTPSSDLASNTTFTVTIKGGATGAKDLAGNALTSNYVWIFTTADVTPPTVVFTDPTCGSSGVSTNKKIAVTFSKAMNQATITTATFTVTGPGGAPVPGTVTYVAASNTAILTTANFASESAYTYTIQGGASGVKDLAGNSLASDFVCGFTTGLAADNTPPTVISTDPANDAIDVALNKIITATFSEAMDLSTITAPGTFTLQGATPVTGVVSYLGTTATFTPGSPLALNTLYTATITTDARDPGGNALASDYVWSFRTTSTPPPPPYPALVNLGSAGNFAVLAGSAVSNTGVTTRIYGDVGSYPTATINGLLALNVIGTLYTTADPIVGAAKVDLTTAYNDAQGRSLNAISLPGQLGGLTLAPGLYVNSTSSGISGTGPNGILTLDAGGDANAVWIFKMGSTLITDAGTSIVLAGNASWKNIYWSVGTSATLGTNSIFYGNILADQAITLTTGATLYGRALTRIAAVTLEANIVDKR